MYAYCGQCGLKNMGDARECFSCGAPLVQTIISDPAPFPVPGGYPRISAAMAIVTGVVVVIFCVVVWLVAAARRLWKWLLPARRQAA